MLAECTDVDVWRRYVESYNCSLSAKVAKLNEKKGRELKKLDAWYQETLPKIIGSRSEKYITHEELTKLMKWKLTRGKFRPRLTELVQTNSEDDVISMSKKAFNQLPDIKKSIETLSTLKAVGPATASAVLAAGAPDIAPFMADESMQALPGLQPLAYTVSFYMNYVGNVKNILKVINKTASNKLTAHEVELALWTFTVAKNLGVDLEIEIEEKIQKKRKVENSSGAPVRKKSKT